MKAYICDQCKGQAETDYPGLSPVGWFIVQRRGHVGNSLNADICSTRCLVALTGSIVDQEIAKAAEARPEMVGDVAAEETTRG